MHYRAILRVIFVFATPDRLGDVDFPFCGLAKSVIVIVSYSIWSVFSAFKANKD